MNSGGASFMGRDFWDGAVSMTKAAQALHSVVDITSPYSSCPVQLTVFIPSQDDEHTIIETLDTIVEAMDVIDKSYEILVIDDASKDRSVEMVRDFMLKHEQLNIVMRINKASKGIARNYIDGAFMGCGTYYRMVAGDNSEPVETMVDIFKSVGDADIIIPYYISRLRQGKPQLFLSKLCNFLINCISGNHINCYTAANIHLRYNVMRWHSDVLGYAFQMDLLCQLLAHDFTCKQVPCRAVSRHGNISGIGIKKSLSMLHAMLNIILRRASRGINGV